METYFNYIINTLLGILLGTLVSKLKNYKSENKTQSKAIRDLLRSQLVNQYYVYKEVGKVPRYVKESWYKMYESYIKLGGNSFVKEDIKPKWDRLENYE